MVKMGPLGEVKVPMTLPPPISEELENKQVEGKVKRKWKKRWKKGGGESGESGGRDRGEGCRWRY